VAAPVAGVRETICRTGHPGRRSPVRVLAMIAASTRKRFAASPPQKTFFKRLSTASYCTAQHFREPSLSGRKSHPPRGTSFCHRHRGGLNNPPPPFQLIYKVLNCPRFKPHYPIISVETAKQGKFELDGLISCTYFAIHSSGKP
jgi:hypothetical protein